MRPKYFLAAYAFVTVALTSSLAQADGYAETFKITPDDPPSDEEFGISIAVDGTLALIGANRADDNGTDSGAAYLYDTATGRLVSKLLPCDGEADDQFGYSVAISGSTALVGAYGDDDYGSLTGSVYTFDTTTGIQMRKLLPPDGEDGDRFGFAVAISGTIALIAAPGDDELGAIAGSVYVMDTVTGLQTAKFLASDGESGDFLGGSLAMSGSIGIVGNLVDSDNGNFAGAAYLFDITTGLELFKLLPLDGTPLHRFGKSVAINDTIALVGSDDDDNGTLAGAAYMFDTATGQQIRKLAPLDADTGDKFGESVGVSGTTAIIGAYNDNDEGISSGSAYLFDTETGVQIEKILARDGSKGDDFGRTVAISGETLLVSAPRDDDRNTGIDDVGSAYVFSPDPVLAQVTQRNGSGLNAPLLTVVTRPILGTDWESDLDCSGHQTSVAALVVHESPFAGFFLPGGELLVDVTSTLVALESLPHSGDVVRFSIQVPNDVSLCGFQSSAQGLVLGAPGYELSNALLAIAGT